MQMCSASRWQSTCKIMTVVKSTGSRFLCHEPLIKMITVQIQSTWHIIRNRCVSQGLNQYPIIMVTNVHCVGECKYNLQSSIHEYKSFDILFNNIKKLRNIVYDGLDEGSCYQKHHQKWSKMLFLGLLSFDEHECHQE